jgi:Bacterial transcriptional activator domain/Transcriptional regulatory protein, C terminal
MRFCVLGPLEVYVDGRSIAVGGGRQRALLALLLVHAGEIVSRDRLIEELWGGRPPASGAQSLDVYVSRLRRALRVAGGGEVLVTRAPGYVLLAEETDARRFEALAAEGRAALAAGDAERASTLLREALGLWRGRAFVEVADEHWARPEAERLEELRLRRWRTVSTPSWHSVATRRSCQSWSSWLRGIPTASGSSASTCWRSTGAGGRPMRSRPIARRVGRWSMSWGWNPDLSCGGSRGRCWHRIQRWTRRRVRGPGRPTLCRARDEGHCARPSVRSRYSSRARSR